MKSVLVATSEGEGYEKEVPVTAVLSWRHKLIQIAQGGRVEFRGRATNED